MAIVKMNKFTLLALESKKEELLEKLQEFSKVQFVNLQDEDLLEKEEDLKELQKDDLDEEYIRYEEELSKAKWALEFLSSYVPQKSGLRAMKEGKLSLTIDELIERVDGSAWEDVYAKLKEKEAVLNSLDNEKTKLEGELEILAPWETLDADLEEIYSLKTPTFIGSIPLLYEEKLNALMDNYYVEVISKGNTDIYFILIANKDKEEEVQESLREIAFSQFKTNLKEKPISIIHTNRERIENIKSERFFVTEGLAALEEEKHNFELVVEYYSNKVLTKKARTNFLKTDKVFVTQGWNAVEDNDKLLSIVKDVLGDKSYIEFEDVKEEEIENVPVKLKNNEFNESFEAITEMYSLPRYNEIDPTPLLVPFYLLFFGMMVADVGYGLMVLIGSLIALKVFNLDDGSKKFAKFFAYLSVPTIFFGIIYGSYFGDLLPIPGLISPTKDVNTILIASVVFGAVQIFAGLGIKAYMLIRDGHFKDAIYDVGTWVLTLISVGVVIAGKMVGGIPNGVVNVFMVLMIIGMVSIVLTQGRQSESIGGKLGQGLYGLYGITGYVSDLVSYTRLMALGLAGGSIAGALNMIMQMIPGIAAIILVPLLFVVAHTLNLGLSLLGAYVHTCRLQYVEYFGKFYEGGGKPFEPFSTENKYINIKK